MKTNISTRLTLAVGTGLLVWAACDQATPTSPTNGPTGPNGIVSLVILPGGAGPGVNDGDRVANHEVFDLCKDGSAATFDYTIFERPSGPTTNGTVTLADGECRVLALFAGLGADVTVTEQDPVGYDLANVVLSTIVNGTTTTGPPSTSPTVGPEWISGSSGGTHDLNGALAIYTNVPEQGGGEGCTPGFWKNWTGLGPQPNVWPNPPHITDLFSSHFDDAFPGMTLLQVVGQGGGGLKALGRHTVAALLNSASPDVSYDISDVVGQFNAVYPGTKSEYNALKNTFAGFNEQETPGFCE